MENKSLLLALATLFITINGLAQTKTVTDVDGNVYHTVTIGTQTWMVENLRTTRYNDSTAIPNVTGDIAWWGMLTPAYCWYDNDAATNKATYGALYNWHTVNTGKLAPKGWHVPTDAEWITLHNYVSANPGTSGSVAKALAATTNWATSTVVGAPGNDLTKNNSTGFSALPGGLQYPDHGIYGIGYGFIRLGETGYWWTSSESKLYTTDAIFRCLNYGAGYLIKVESEKKSGMSVRCIQSNAQINITGPAKGETVLADAKYIIQWNSTGIDSIKIEYSADDGTTFKTITNSVPAAAGSFAWHVPDTLSSKCKLVITNLDDPSDTAVLSNFRIKGYVLTRFKANGDYEAYDPAVHGWQFKNDGNMWPEIWWNQFDYIHGIDPNTGERYPSEFMASYAKIYAHSSDFPDWPLYSHTFGIDRCYGSMSPVTYSPSAERYWRYIKSDFKGSCFGFAISSLLEFDFPDAFRAFFPQIGSYTNLIELPLNNYRRSVINQLFQYQFGSAARTFEKTRKLRTPRETLQDAKDNFLSPIGNHRGLSLFHNYTLGGKPGGHEVVPYALRKIPKTSKFELLVYDSNCPTGNCPSYGKPAVLIDSLYNTWYYSPLKWGSGILTQGLYLDSPANTYLLRPSIPDTVSDQIVLGEKTMLQVMNTTSASITISDSSGNAIGFADSTGVNTIPDSYPIIPRTGTPEAPIGYVIPSGSYTITLNAFRDSVASVGVFGNSSVFSYWRSDAVSNQTDRLLYHSGMEFRNPDTHTKTINLEAINRVMDCESGFQILNCTVGQNDSVRLEMPDINSVAFVNQGPSKTYDLNIVEACSSLSGQFKHDNITIPAHSTHFIVPDLQDLPNNPVKIYEDIGNTGIISDTLFVTNVTTGIENPMDNRITGKFSLIQNYPNPFSSITTFKYRVTKPGFVSLKVFDVLGIEVASLANEQKPVGEYSIDWNASGLAGGIYFCKLQNGNNSTVKKMLLMK